MNTDGNGFHTCKECHKTESFWNHTTTDRKEGEQLVDRSSVGASSCKSWHGKDQRVQSLMFMMMMMMVMMMLTLMLLTAVLFYSLLLKLSSFKTCIWKEKLCGSYSGLEVVKTPSALKLAKTIWMQRFAHRHHLNSFFLIPSKHSVR